MSCTAVIALLLVLGWRAIAVLGEPTGRRAYRCVQGRVVLNDMGFVGRLPTKASDARRAVIHVGFDLGDDIAL